MFKKRKNVAAIEEGKLLSPKFDKDGLIPVVTTDCKTGEVLMHGYMNSEALKKTIETNLLIGPQNTEILANSFPALEFFSCDLPNWK